MRLRSAVEFTAFLALLFALFAIVAQCTGCMPGTSRPAAYTTELVACSELSKTLLESVRCENEVRARYGRPLRHISTDADGGLQ